MKLNAVMNSKLAVTVGAVLAGGLVFFLVTKKAAAATGEAISEFGGDALSLVDPTYGGNIIKRGVDAIGDAIDDGDSGNDSFALGSWVYDLVNPAYDPNAPVTDAQRDAVGYSPKLLR